MRWDCGEHRVKIVEEGERGVAWGANYPVLVDKRSLGEKMRFSDAITAQDGLEDVVVVTIPCVPEGKYIAAARRRVRQRDRWRRKSMRRDREEL